MIFKKNRNTEKKRPPSSFLHSFLLVIFPFSMLMPVSASAQAIEDVFGLSAWVLTIMTSIGRLFWLLAIMLFFWGVVKFIANTSDTAEHEEGKKFMLWGVIAFVVLVSLWAIVELVLFDSLGITPGGELKYVDKNNVFLN